MLFENIHFAPGGDKNLYLFVCMVLILSLVLSQKKSLKLITVVLLLVSSINVYNSYLQGSGYKVFVKNAMSKNL